MRQESEFMIDGSLTGQGGYDYGGHLNLVMRKSAFCRKFKSFVQSDEHPLFAA